MQLPVSAAGCSLWSSEQWLQRSQRAVIRCCCSCCLCLGELTPLRSLPVTGAAVSEQPWGELSPVVIIISVLHIHGMHWVVNGCFKIPLSLVIQLFLGAERRHMPPNIHFSNMLACLCCMLLNNWEYQNPLRA